MKNLFGVNKDIENQGFDGEIFKTRSLDGLQENEADDVLEEVAELQKSASLPGWLAVVQYISMIGAAIIGVSIITALGDQTFDEVYQNAPYLFYILGVFVVIYLGLLFYKNSLAKKVEDTVDIDALQKKVFDTFNENAKALNVSENHKIIDVIGFVYKMKNDEMKIVSSGTYKYHNNAVRIFMENDDFCITDLYQVWSIPKSSIKGIEKIEKRMMLDSWNKDEKINSPKYKPYKIAMNQYGQPIIKSYYKISINDVHGEFELLIPCYEIDSLKEIIDI